MQSRKHNVTVWHDTDSFWTSIFSCVYKVQTVLHCWHIIVLVISPPNTWSTKFFRSPCCSYSEIRCADVKTRCSSIDKLNRNKHVDFNHGYLPWTIVFSFSSLSVFFLDCFKASVIPERILCQDKKGTKWNLNQPETNTFSQEEFIMEQPSYKTKENYWGKYKL